mgnify:CR=1
MTLKRCVKRETKNLAKLKFKTVKRNSTLDLKLV